MDIASVDAVGSLFLLTNPAFYGTKQEQKGKVCRPSNFPRTPKPRARGSDRVKIREIIRLLEQNGWVLIATKGSHRQYKHPARAGRVTVAGKPSDDLAPGTLNSILKQAGLKETR
jgi:predicted RNA binding protein YcfA (HicA-like mRNA interferase family)